MRASAALGFSLLAVGLTGCAGDQPSPNVLLPATDQTVTVYVFADDDLLHRTDVPVDGDATVEAAVEALGAYAPSKPLDTLWTGACAPGKDLDKVTVTKDQVSVHFNDDGGATCRLRNPAVVEQQLAWTVRTATGSKAPVVVTVGKDPAPVMKVRANKKYLAPRQ